MQFKTVRHRDQDGNYHEGKTVQCLRRVRETQERGELLRNLSDMVIMIALRNGVSA